MQLTIFTEICLSIFFSTLITQWTKVNRECERCSCFPLSSYFYLAASILAQYIISSVLLNFFLSHFLLLFLTSSLILFFLFFKCMFFFHFCLSLHSSDSPLSSQKPFLNSSITSDPFHQHEKANYLPFYYFHYFTTHTVFYYWAVGSLH